VRRDTHAEIFGTGGLLPGSADRSRCGDEQRRKGAAKQEQRANSLSFQDADALGRFGKVAKAADAVVTPLLACKAPQGSKVDVLGSGYRTAFVRVVEGSANGCQGTVPIGNVRDQ
jgi:hypothetical protein